jgi:hypothetical protein
VYTKYDKQAKSHSRIKLGKFNTPNTYIDRRARKGEIKNENPSNFNLFSAKYSYLWFIEEPLKSYLFLF